MSRKPEVVFSPGAFLESAVFFEDRKEAQVYVLLQLAFYGFVEHATTTANAKTNVNGSF